MALRFLLLAFVFILNGCASATGPVFKSAEISKDKALIYVYRKDLGHWQSAYSPTFILDEKDIASLPREGYLQLYVTSGEHTFGFKHNFLAGYKPVSLNMTISAGQIYYLKISDPIGFEGRSCPAGFLCTNYRSEIAVIERDVALKELATTKLVIPSN